ncbi:MAG: hypothetical protein ABI390_11225 [Daejeonella sp.]
MVISNPDLQQELKILWESRVKSIDGLTEDGRKFKFNKPMSYLINNSQKNYQFLLKDMNKQLHILRKKTEILQKEMNKLLKLINNNPPSL